MAKRNPAYAKFYELGAQEHFTYFTLSELKEQILSLDQIVAPDAIQSDLAFLHIFNAAASYFQINTGIFIPLISTARPEEAIKMEYMIGSEAIRSYFLDKIREICYAGTDESPQTQAFFTASANQALKLTQNRYTRYWRQLPHIHRPIDVVIPRTIGGDYSITTVDHFPSPNMSLTDIRKK